MNDLKFAIRQLLKNPGFTAVAVLTLALGIGANTAIFSVVNAVLLKPLPYHEPERIVTLLHDGRFPVAAADFLDWRAQNMSFETMAAAEAWSGTMTGVDRPEAILGLRLGEGMFPLLGVPPLVGRTFQPGDYQAGSARVVVLSHRLWQRRFAGDPKVVGQSLRLSGEPYTVVGVMPPEFQFAPFWATKSEMWAPLDLPARATQREGGSLRVFARLKPGVWVAQAQAEMDGICQRLAAAYPDTNTGRTVRVDPLLEKVVGNLRPALRVLVGAVVFVLLIACANVANLLLVRAACRQKEMAIRAALGASRWRTIRQLLTESVLLALIAGMLGLLLGFWSIESIKGLLTGDATPFRARMPRVTEITLDSATLMFTLGVALLTGVVFGLAPIVHAARPGLQGTLKEGGRGTTEARGGPRLRSALVVAEIALALVTLAGAGLMLRSFAGLTAIDPGFDSHNVLSLIVSLHGQPDMIGEKREAFYAQLLERVGALPGVTSVSAINHLPLAGDTWGRGISVEGRPPPKPGEAIGATYRVCRPAYFQTMGISLLRGRDFTGQDKADTQGVAIINEQLARKHWPGEDPVGRRITLDDPRNNPNWLTIVGVVKNVKQSSWIDAAGDEVYVPFSQSPFLSNSAGHYSAMTLVLRTASNPLGLARTVQDAVWNLNRSVPVSGITTLEEVISNTVWQQRFHVVLVALFASVALTLAMVGIYGVMASAVTERTREIGIRMALGAQRRDVLRLAVRQGMTLALIGMVLGVLGALGLTRLMTNLLYEVKPTDPITFVCVSALLTGIALLACWLPARRAAKIDPMEALRCE